MELVVFHIYENYVFIYLKKNKCHFFYKIIGYRWSIVQILIY